MPRPIVLLAALIPACAPYGDVALAVTAGDPGAAADECALPCFTVAASRGGEPMADASLTLARDGDVALAEEVRTDAAGEAEVCLAPGALAPGTTPLRVSLGEVTLEVPTDVRPFGWDVGLDKVAGAPDTLAYTPDVTLPETPILRPAADSWYAFQVTHPYLSDEGLLAFAGTAHWDGGDDHNPYQIGLARIDGGVVVEVSAAPLFEGVDATWGTDARNAPELHRDAAGDLVVWFHSPDPEPAIGRAVSTDDGATWTLDDANPIFGADSAASHPTLIDHGDGVVELWFAAEGGIGYAVSDDAGATFARYCHNPVLGRGESGGVKSPQVVWHEDRYLAAPTRGADPTWGIAWAESYDGVRWREADAPVLEPGGAGWSDLGVAGAQILVEDDGIALLFVGTGREAGESGIGIAR